LPHIGPSWHGRDPCHLISPLPHGSGSLYPGQSWNDTVPRSIHLYHYTTCMYAVLHQLDQKIIYPHHDFKHLTEKYFEIGMKLNDFSIQLVKYWHGEWHAAS
jgi:hypothetical protein